MGKEPEPPAPPPPKVEEVKPKIEEPPPKVEEPPPKQPEGPPPPDLKPGEFLVTLNRDSGNSGHIGVNVSHVTEGSKNVALEVKEVKEGLVDTWNRSNPDKMVKPGHQIVCANDIRGDSDKMLEPIATAKCIVLIIKAR